MSTIGDVAVSVGFSLLTCGTGNVLSEKATYETLKAGKKAIKDAYQPLVAKTAIKQLHKAIKKIGKQAGKEYAEYTGFFLLERGTRWCLNNATGYDLI